jgi:hypothetical protein
LAVNDDIAGRRLLNLRIDRPGGDKPSEIVASLGAVQAQEYSAAKWGLALRMPEGTTDAMLDRAIDSGSLLRTHVLRPTWHFVTPSDIGWMLELTAPHVHRVMSYYNRPLGLGAATLARGTRIIERALRDGQHLTRAELGARLERAWLPASGPRLARLVMHAELERVICSGPRRGRHFTYALLAERAPNARSLPPEEAIAELTRRYFSSHGPATIRDFVWWSGLKTADAKRGLEMVRARRLNVAGLAYWTVGRTPPIAARRRRRTVHLLPIYDEYLVAYRDRVAVPHGPSTIDTRSGGLVTFQHALVIAGQVAGTWKVFRGGIGGCRVGVVPLRRLTLRERRELLDASSRFGRFLEMPVSLDVA